MLLPFIVLVYLASTLFKKGYVFYFAGQYLIQLQHEIYNKNLKALIQGK